MIEELYLYTLDESGNKINYTRIDIDKVDIVRTYTSLYFSDVEQLKNNGTYTIKLPQTAKNKAFFEYCNRLDMNSSLPYDFLYADYFYNGMTIFMAAEVRMLNAIGAFEIQCVYGVNRKKYFPLFEKKLNEIVPNGTTILESDWIINWNPDIFSTAFNKCKYIDYVGGERVSDAQIIGTDIQPVVKAPEPYLSSLNQMTTHPFVEFNTILDLINEDSLCDVDFTTLKSRLTNKGLLLGGNKDNYTESFTYNYTALTLSSQYLKTGNNENGSGILYNGILNIQDFSFNFFDKFKVLGIKYPQTIKITLKLEISNNIGGLSLYKIGGPFPGTLMTFIPYVSNRGGYLKYDTVIELDAEESSVYIIKFNTVTSTETYINATYKTGGSIVFDVKRDNAIYSLYPSNWIGGGRYNVLYNLPIMTEMEFIQQMLIMTGCCIGYDINGELKTYTYDDILISNSIDWSKKISKITKGSFNFNSNAQKNWIKFTNSKDTNYISKGSINVLDYTLATEKDLYTLKFDNAIKATDGSVEFILYKQKVTSDFKTPDPTITFANEYSEKNDVCVYNANGILMNENVISNDADNVKTNIKYIANPIFSTPPNNTKYSYNVIQNPYYNSYELTEINLFSEIEVGGVVISYISFGDEYILSTPLNIISFDSETGIIELDGTLPCVDISSISLTKRREYTNKFRIADYSNSVGLVPDEYFTIVEIDGNTTTVYIVGVDWSGTEPIFTLSESIFYDENQHFIKMNLNTKGFISKYYSKYQKIALQPTVIECDVNLGMLESATIDFAKPIYVGIEAGKYAMLLELQAPNNEVCAAKLLLINQTL